MDAQATSPAREPPAQRAEPPAGHHEPPPAQPRPPGFLARGRLRRRVRFLRKARELGYRDLGGLVFEMQRMGERHDELVAAKLATLGASTPSCARWRRRWRPPSGDGAARGRHRGLPALRGDPRQRGPLLSGLRPGDGPPRGTAARTAPPGLRAAGLRARRRLPRTPGQRAAPHTALLQPCRRHRRPLARSAWPRRRPCPLPAAAPTAARDRHRHRRRRRRRRRARHAGTRRRLPPARATGAGALPLSPPVRRRRLRPPPPAREEDRPTEIIRPGERGA